MKSRIALLDVLQNHLSSRVVCIVDLQLALEDIHNMSMDKSTIKTELESISKCENIQKLTENQYRVS